MVRIEHTEDGANSGSQTFRIHRVHVETLGPAGLNQAGGHERTQMVAHQRLRQALGLDQFAHTTLTQAQRFEEPEPGGVGQRPQDGEGVRPINRD